MNWHEHFTYDEATGNLIWKHRPREAFKNKQAFGAWTTKYAGQVAGCVLRGYVRVRLAGRPDNRPWIIPNARSCPRRLLQGRREASRRVRTHRVSQVKAGRYIRPTFHQ